MKTITWVTESIPGCIVVFVDFVADAMVMNEIVVFWVILSVMSVNDVFGIVSFEVVFMLIVEFSVSTTIMKSMN